MEVSVNHSLSKDEAKSRISNLVLALKESYKDKVTDMNENWQGYTNNFSFKMQGMKIKGVLNVLDNSVKITGKLPLMAMPFKSMIERTIKMKALELLRK